MPDWVLWIVLSAWIAYCIVGAIDGPARARRAIAERQAILDAIRGLDGDAQSSTILDLVAYRLRYRIGPEMLFLVLYRLEREGAIISRWGPPAEPLGPRPRLYRTANPRDPRTDPPAAPPSPTHEPARRKLARALSCRGLSALLVIVLRALEPLALPRPALLDAVDPHDVCQR